MYLIDYNVSIKWNTDIYCALYVIKNTEEKYDMIWYMKIELKAKLPYNLNCSIIY